MRVAITGSTGRLGSAVSACVSRHAGWQAVPWTREEFDLDAPGTIDRAMARDDPDVVVHCAAWTNVDACARDPELAASRNGAATGVLARACARTGTSLVVVSTNEVFDGRRLDRRPYRVGDPPSPANAYGRSKRLGEEQASAAFGNADGRLWIVRTAWLFGPPGTDFPAKIVAAGRAAIAAGRALSLVVDEVGSPTYAPDLAAGIVDLIGHPRSAGLKHVVNRGRASRAAWARRILTEADLKVPTIDVTLAAWPRDSTPPRWGVLAPTALPTMGRLRTWQLALAEDFDRQRVTGPGEEMGEEHG